MKATWTLDGYVPKLSKKDKKAFERWAERIQSDIDKETIRIILGEVWFRELATMYRQRDKAKGFKRMTIQDRIDEHKKNVIIQ